jgi:hypothetical protein
MSQYLGIIGNDAFYHVGELPVIHSYRNNSRTGYGRDKIGSRPGSDGSVAKMFLLTHKIVRSASCFSGSKRPTQKCLLTVSMQYQKLVECNGKTQTLPDWVISDLSVQYEVGSMQRSRPET